jgi:hypothetical protein
MKRKSVASNTIGASQKLSATAKSSPATSGGASMRPNLRQPKRPGGAAQCHSSVSAVKRKR